MESFRRIITFGWERFIRDKSSTIGALVVMVAAVSVGTGIFLVHGAGTLTIQQLRESVDISAYFEDIALEDEILQVRERVLDLPGVVRADYISKEQALERFEELHRSDPVVLESLNAVGQNPLKASLNIKTENAQQLGEVTEFLEQGPPASLIASVDYYDRLPVIERVSAVIEGIQKGVLVVSIVVAVIALLVVFNTIRLTIYISREEIEVMRLVGASTWFIRGPFIVQGVIVGTIASLITLGLFLGLAFAMPQQLERLYLGFSLTDYLISNLPLVVAIQLGIGVGLGVAASLIAIRRYLKV